MAGARIIPFPVIPRKEAFLERFEMIGSFEEIEEYRAYINKLTSHKIIKMEDYKCSLNTQV